MSPKYRESVLFKGIDPLIAMLGIPEGSRMRLMHSTSRLLECRYYSPFSSPFCQRVTVRSCDLPQPSRFLSCLRQRDQRKSTQAHVTAFAFNNRPEHPTLRAGWFYDEIKPIAVRIAARVVEVSYSYCGQSLFRVLSLSLMSHRRFNPPFPPTFIVGCRLIVTDGIGQGRGTWPNKIGEF